MTNTKGMSQTLALIVAASVLMMTALTVIFLAQGALGDFGQDSSSTSCKSAVNAKCRAAIQTSGASNPTIATPSSCLGSGGSPISLDTPPRWGTIQDSDNTECEQPS